MDFDSLPRRDLQSLCKKNKIPANMTNIAMADALKALEIVEGLEELLNQTESTAPPSPTTVVKELPTTARTAIRTSRRTNTKDATQTSQWETRSCQVTRKSLAGEMDQENKNMNVLQSSAVPASRRRAATSVAQNSESNDGETQNEAKFEANVPKTPAARSTRRKAPLPASSRSKAPETKKDESVQQVYSTRRSVRLLEKSMADLSLKPKGDLDEKDKAAQEKDLAGPGFQGKLDDNSERAEQTEVIPGRDLSATLEKEWDMRNEALEHDNGSGDPEADPEIVESEANIDLGDVSVSDAKSEICKEKMNEVEIFKGCDTEETGAEGKGSEVMQDLDCSLQVTDKELSQAGAALSPGGEKTIHDDNSEVWSGHAASATSPVAAGDIMDSEFEKEPVEPEQINAKDDDEDDDQTIDEALKEDTLINEDAALSMNTDHVSAHHPLQDSNTDSDDSESEFEETEDTEEEEEGSEVESTEAVNDASLEVDNVEMDSSSESSESDPEEDSTISDADSNTAVFGSDASNSESEEYENNVDGNKKKTPTPEGKGKTPMSPPFAAESISGQFPRPTLSTTPASEKKQPIILADVDKENTESYKAEMPKKNAFDEEGLRKESLRQLTKMVKDLVIKTNNNNNNNNRTALQSLPDNQIN